MMIRFNRLMRISLFVLLLSLVWASTSQAQLENTKIVFWSDRDGNREIYVMDADGTNPIRLTNHPAVDIEPSWSPDGKQIAFRSERDGNSEIYVMNADGTNPINLTSHPASDTQPSWSPDGIKIAFVSHRNQGLSEIYVMNADGTNQVPLIIHGDSPSWSPDGTKIVFGRTDDIHVMNLDGTNLVNLTNSRLNNTAPSWSPEGTQIAFMSRRVGEIYVMNADGTNQTQLTNADGDKPSWSPDGTKITFSSNQKKGEDDIFVMNADGTNPVNLTNHLATDIDPAWSPVLLPPNQPPIADSQNPTTPEDTPVSITLTGSDPGSDPDGDPLIFTVETQPTNGTLTGTAPNLSYTPNGNFNGPDSFTFEVNDGMVDSNTATVTITVIALNDPPTFALSRTTVSVNEDFSGTETVTVIPDAVPADEASQQVSYTLSPSSASFANTSLDSSTGEISIAAIADGNGTQTFTVTADDDQSENNQAAQTFTLTVQSVNDVPTVANPIVDVTVDEDALNTVIDLSGVFADVDIATNGDVLTFSLSGGAPALLTATLTETSLTLDYLENQNDTAIFTVTATDAGAPALQVRDQFTVTVNAVNDDPILAAIGDQATNEGTDFSVALSASDVDMATNAQSLTFSAISGDESLVKVAIESTGVNTATLSLDVQENQNGAAAITVAVDDSNGGTDSASFTLTVNTVTPPATFDLTALDATELVPEASGVPILVGLAVQGKNGYNDSITLDIGSGLPTGVEAKLTPTEVSLTPEEPSQLVQLELRVSDEVPAADYSFTVSAFAADGSQFKRLPLTLKIESPDTIRTFLIITLDPSSNIPLGGAHKLFGSLNVIGLPDSQIDLQNLVIRLTLTSPSGGLQNFEAKTDVGGRYQLEDTFLLNEIGAWNLTADFDGNEPLEASQSVPVAFDVIKGSSEVVFDSPTDGRLGTEIEIFGRLDPALEGERLTLKILRPDGAASTLTDITTEALGVFRHTLKLELAGDWEITATWAGNEQYERAMQTLAISVSEEIGKAILVLGGGNSRDNKYWDLFNPVAEYVYETFGKRQFDDQADIHFLSPDPTLTEGADTETTLNTLQLAITDWAKSQVNPQIPLYLYLLSHNLGDQFLLRRRGNDQVFLSPALLNDWLSELPQGTPVTIIIEACHSGNFISSSEGAPSALVGENRTIIVSARGDKQAKISQSRFSFSTLFFNRIRLNAPIAEAFRGAQMRMAGIGLLRDQFPQMDANGNGAANEPHDFAALENSFLPADFVSLAVPPEFIGLTEPTTLGEGISSLRIEAELLGVDISRVLATVIPPTFDPTQTIDDWGELAFDEFDLALVSEGKYAAAYAGFTIPGDYTVIVDAENPDGGADPVQTTITVPAPSTPWDVNGDGVVNVFDLVIVGSEFGRSGPGLQGDVTGDGVVNIFDLVTVGSHFGE